MTVRRLSFQVDRFIGFYLWALFIVVFGIWKPDQFLTSSTLHSVASAQAITALVGIAVLIPLVAGAYDLSVGATAGLATVLAVWLQSDKGVPMVPAIIGAIAAGALIGAVNGFVVVKLKVNSFIATLGMASIVMAVQTIVVGSTQPFPPTSQLWTKFTSTTILGFQLVVVYLLIIAALAWWLLARMPAGRYMYAVGGNAEAAHLAGVSVGRSVFLSLQLSGVIAGTAGVLYGSLYGPSLVYGQGLLLPAFAAAFLGSVLARGKFNVWGTVMAVYILATGVKGMQFVTSAQWLSDMFNGVVLILAVAFAMWRRQKVAKSLAHAAAHGRGTTPGGDSPTPAAATMPASAQAPTHHVGQEVFANRSISAQPINEP